MDLSFSPETEAFREEVRRFIEETLPADIRKAVTEERMDLPREYQKRWHEILNAKGWSCSSWPKEHGGQGWSDEQHYAFEREIALGDAPRAMIYALHMLGPTLLEFGTEDQKRRFLPPMVSGEVFWCQGFSEPGSGSDLASLQCKAVRGQDAEGEHYLVNGTKIWTSEAHIADWIFGLYRTDSSGKKQQGITVLLIDLKTPGIAISPLMTYEGTLEVNQVFFENVRVPVENRLGDEHHGWTLAKYLLSLERFGTAEISRSLASLARLKKVAAEQEEGGRPLIEDSDFAGKIAAVEIELRALEITEQRFLFGPGGADAMGAEASMLKVRGTELQQRVLELTVEALGYYAHPALPDDLHQAGSNEPPVGPDQARFSARAHFNFRKTAIYSGSNEIQKNIIAKAVLGL